MSLEYQAGGSPPWATIIAAIEDLEVQIKKVEVNDKTGFTSAPTASSIVAGSFGAGAITASVMATGAIDADAIASNAITDAKIASGAITSAKFASGAIDAAAIAADAITASKIASQALAGQLIRSIQYGTVSMAGVLSNTTTITAVTVARTMLLHLGQECALDNLLMSARITLTNSTTITATRGTSDAAATSVSFCAVEFM